MRAVLDHIGIAVKDLHAALAFYRDALGLDVEPPEEVASQHVRAHFMPVGGSKLELLEATDSDSPIAKYVDKRGPGLHHITLRVDDIDAAVSQLKARRVRLIDEQPRPGAEGSMIAFVHPSATHGVLLELKQAGTATRVVPPLRPQRFPLGNLELVSLSDGSFRMDGGAMFGVAPKTKWSKKTPADERNRVSLVARPLVIRGARTMIVDAGLGDKGDAEFLETFGVDRRYHLDHALADAGLTVEDIDIVLASHLHFDHAGGFTARDAGGRLRPRFPRAQYIVRRGEWEAAMERRDGIGARYSPDDFAPLADAGVLQLVDHDATIMPGVKVRRTGGHTLHHQIVLMESEGKHAVFAADLVPTALHLQEGWIPSLDLYPVESRSAIDQCVQEAVEHHALVLFEHDPLIAAGHIHDADGRRTLE